MTSDAAVFEFRRLVASPACSLFGGLALVSATACSGVPERVPYEVDCNPAGIELKDPPVDAFEADDLQWYSAGDTLTYGRAEESIEQVELEEARCGSERALQLYSRGHNDWGSAFGFYGPNSADGAIDASDWDGFAIWAKAAPNTTRAVNIELTDRYGSQTGLITEPEVGVEVGTCVPVPDPYLPPASQSFHICTKIDDEDAESGYRVACEDLGFEAVLAVDSTYICYEVADGQIECGTYALPEAVRLGAQQCVEDAEGNRSCGDSQVSGPHDCNNAFARPFEFSTRWELHLLPFDSFYQDDLPNRRPLGMDTSAIHLIALPVPRGAELDVLIDDITLYRRTE
jgi:hypothetical protein